MNRIVERERRDKYVCIERECRRKTLRSQEFNLKKKETLAIHQVAVSEGSAHYWMPDSSRPHLGPRFAYNGSVMQTASHVCRGEATRWGDKPPKRKKFHAPVHVVQA